jgi:3-methyladenine DNA glycosylase AlkD
VTLDAAREATALCAQLAAAGNAVRAEQERRYLRSELEHWGLAVPDMRRTVRSWWRAHRPMGHDDLFAMTAALWEQPVHEARSAAVELLTWNPSSIGAADLPFLEARLRECRTWALVDTLASSVVGRLALEEPAAVLPVLDRWATDGDFWIRRSAVLALRASLLRDMQLDRFFGYAEQLLPEREFFIRKALGWVLREVAARHPARVSAWLRAHMGRLNLVTLREPLRRLPDSAELRALYDARRNSSG